MIRLAIVGGRDYTNYNNFKKIVDTYIEEIGIPTEIISGGAKGIDTMAAVWANENNIPIIEFKPDWATYGKKAGILRNTDIINESTHVLALPTKKSIGTHDSIRKAKDLNKILKVIDV
jgi:hypothetical protein